MVLGITAELLAELVEELSTEMVEELNVEEAAVVEVEDEDEVVEDSAELVDEGAAELDSVELETAELEEAELVVLELAELEEAELEEAELEDSELEETELEVAELEEAELVVLELAELLEELLLLTLPPWFETACLNASLAASASPSGQRELRQLWTLLPSFSPRQEMSLTEPHSEESLLTSATHANRQAGGVAKTCLDNKAKETTVERTDVVRIM